MGVIRGVPVMDILRCLPTIRLGALATQYTIKLYHLSGLPYSEEHTTAIRSNAKEAETWPHPSVKRMGKFAFEFSQAELKWDDWIGKW